MAKDTSSLRFDARRQTAMPEKKYDTPLVKKLGIKPGHRLLIVNEPTGFRELLIGLAIGRGRPN